MKMQDLESPKCNGQEQQEDGNVGVVEDTTTKELVSSPSAEAAADLSPSSVKDNSHIHTDNSTSIKDEEKSHLNEEDEAGKVPSFASSPAPSSEKAATAAATANDSVDDKKLMMNHKNNATADHTMAIETEDDILNSIQPLPRPTAVVSSEPGAYAVSSATRFHHPLQQHNPTTTAAAAAAANNSGASTTNNSTLEAAEGDLEQQTGGSDYHENSGLVSAFPVNEDEHSQDIITIAEQAQPVDPNSLKRTRKAYLQNTAAAQQRHLLMAILGVILLCGLILGIVFGVNNHNHNNNTNGEAPTTLVDEEEHHNVSTSTLPPLLSKLKPALTTDTLETILAGSPSSPQHRAYHWMEQDPWLENFSPERLVQRFAMATFYYATNGEEWTLRGSNDGPTTVFYLNRTVASEIERFRSSDVLKPPPGPSPSSGRQLRQRQLQDDLGEARDIAAAEWMSYGRHECDWYSGVLLDGMYSPCNDDGQLEWLHLKNNNLVGSLTPEIGLLSHLKGLQLWKNRLTGFIPHQIFTQMTNLEILDLASCEGFKGTIPREIGLLSNSLMYFGVLHNQLTGPVPDELWELSKLQVLKLDRNDFTGTLPHDMGSRVPALKLALIGLTQMTGTIPSSLGLCTDLVFFDAFKCGYSGTLPTELGNLSSLARTFLHGNQLSGSLPSELARIPNLYELRLEGNIGLTGAVPLEWGQLNGTLKTLGLTETSVVGSIPEELCSVQGLGFDCSDQLCGCNCTCAQ